MHLRRIASALLLLLLSVDSRDGRAESPCAGSGGGWCLARRVTGEADGGELGFRFGEPLDVDGDQVADIAAGMRFTRFQGVAENGRAAVWSGRTGVKIRSWDGEHQDGLLGHWVLPVPDVSGDALADVVLSAPNAKVGNVSTTGLVTARSPKTGKVLWSRPGDRHEQLGWDLCVAGDQNGDGTVDVFAGAPSASAGRAYLLSGKDGTVLQTYSPKKKTFSFGWSVARVDDLDRDGRSDLAVGAYREKGVSDAEIGGVHVLSAATGQPIFYWIGQSSRSGFGEVVAALGDINGDGRGEIVVGAPRSDDDDRVVPGEVFVHSGADGAVLHRWKGKQPKELYGRMVVSAGEIDGDGVEDVAIGAPWHHHDFVAKVGRIELRSGRTGAVLHEMFGDVEEAWFGWHIRRAPDPDGMHRPALLISSVRHPIRGKAGVGVLDLYVLQKASDRKNP
ncbi:MAG TPA: hypothetical protein VEC57_13185 [Candidatus Limnocylindrales bacterium]|nr:hypothetical protein [Candidatus Limnocylindrales bacterium]